MCIIASELSFRTGGGESSSAKNSVTKRREEGKREERKEGGKVEKETRGNAARSSTKRVLSPSLAIFWPNCWPAVGKSLRVSKGGEREGMYIR